MLARLDEYHLTRVKLIREPPGDSAAAPMTGVEQFPMSILGVIVRCHPSAVAGVEQRLRDLPGVELADTGAAAADGRVVIVIEDHPGHSAAATLGAIALWPDVLNTSLVYEYSGPDSPAPDDVADYRDWRRDLTQTGPRSAA